jgi:hypothetical protein
VTPKELMDFLADQLSDPETAWSLGTFGAIAEFVRDGGEAATLHRGDREISVVTARGGLRLEAHVKLRPIASESPTAESWGHRVALCLPDDAAAMNRRACLTEIGPDTEALRDQDRSSVLFDLGLGAFQVDACIRTGDPPVIEALRRHAGKSVFDPDSGAMGTILASNPHRVFMSRAGRAEVFQPIPPPDGRSPDGPHTHVLPKLLAHRRTHPATEPVPQGFVPCAHFYPPHPMRDGLGRSQAFQTGRHTRFQNLLLRFGDPDSVALKRRIIYSVMAGRGPDEMKIGGSRFARATIRVALRQLQASQTPSAALTSWLSVYDRTERNETQDLAEAQH